MRGGSACGPEAAGSAALTSSEKGSTRGASEAMLVFSASAAVGTTLRCSMMPRMPSCARSRGCFKPTGWAQDRPGATGSVLSTAPEQAPKCKA